jgi:hypothetical protein
MTDISDQDLLNLIIAADDETFQKGTPPKGRWMPVVSTVMKKLGQPDYVLAGVGTPPIVERIGKLHSSLYRTSDTAIGGIHAGIFMFRDVFARISIPLMYGTAQMDLFKLTDLSSTQLQWLGSRPADRDAYIDQATDVFDFAGGIANLAQFETPPEEARQVFHNAGFQLQAAAATLSLAFDFRGAVQSALMGAELALKGALAAKGLDAEQRRKHSHKLDSAAKAVAQLYPGFDLERALTVIAKLPPLVENRYSAEQPSRVETGHIVMGAQYIAGEAMRQVTGYSIRQAFRLYPKRNYPPV